MADKRDSDVMLLLTKMAERDERNRAEHEELRRASGEARTVG